MNPHEIRPHTLGVSTEPILYSVIHGDNYECLLTFDAMEAYTFLYEVDGHMESFSSWDDIKIFLGENFTPEQIETLYNQRFIYYHG